MDQPGGGGGGGIPEKIRRLAKIRSDLTIGLETASQNRSTDTHKTPYDRVKWCRELKINIKASERVNVDWKGAAVVQWLDYSHPHMGGPGSTPDVVSPGFSHVGVVLDDAALVGGFSRGSPIIGSQTFQESPRVPRGSQRFLGFFRALPPLDAFELCVLGASILSRRAHDLLCLVTARLPPRRTGLDSRRGHFRILACGNRAGRCRWLPPPLHSGAAPYSPHSTLIGLQDPEKPTGGRNEVSAEQRRNERTAENGRSPRKPADQRLRPARLPQAPCHLPKLSVIGLRNIVESSSDCCCHLIRPDINYIEHLYRSWWGEVNPNPRSCTYEQQGAVGSYPYVCPHLSTDP
ncbi:hypothetical protein PR048_000212 [Dryococelus australis]|uniref:Uncharacterized protein n=1 Tax=Dryococelus australis TaxID=614101 RepID=A0ABQ9IE05_9NEOP|nr:hypothetical protein PR048_000212 [Dryococelus australis]